MLKFLNQNGVALAQVMVVAGFVGLVSLGVANLTDQMAKKQKDAEIREEKIFLTGEILGILGDSRACINSFAGLDAAKDNTTEVKDSAGTTRFVKGISYGNQNLDITNFKLDDSSDQVGLQSPGAGTTFLTINFAKKKGVYSNKDYRIKLSVITDINDKIVSCHALSSGSDRLWQNSSSVADAIFFSGKGVGVNLSAPKSALDIAGPLKVGSDSKTCTAEIAGTVSYRNTAGPKGLYICYNESWLKVKTIPPPY